MRVQVMPTLKPYLVRWERGVIKKQAVLMKVLRNYGDVSFRRVNQEQERQDRELVSNKN